ncbi:MAG: hypothetical protein LQ345_000705 [Seirophora villosa]|nr:MAG: hypothetical protein LQ345_000705 [Seirophora villosa]
MTLNPALSVSHVPDEPPPSYDAATAPPTSTSQSSSNQHSLRARNGIPPAYRRSMEDEGRPLPQGWVRQYDPDNDHQFFVDTTREPPRSIWHHPYDDDDYMNSLDPTERQKIRGTLQVPSHGDIAAESSDEDRDDHPPPHTAPANNIAANPSQQQPAGASKLGRKLKDKLTNTTHEQREEQRRQRAIAEEQFYERHRQLRRAMVMAMRTGQPQLVGKDHQGKDVYIEPPPTAASMRSRGGYNPYAQGIYGNPNARFIRPANPYQRPYGRGYGGGYGLPLAGGLMGGMLMGSMMGGGYGGGFGGGDGGGGGGGC